MKKLLTLLSVVLILSSCTKEEEVEQINLDSFSTYWYFSTNTEPGRGVAFAFTTTEPATIWHELIFDWSISNQDIIIELVGTVYKRECTKFPMTDGKCQSSGSIFIPEHLIPAGDYNLVLKAPGFQVQAAFSFDNSKYTLIIPSNPHLSSSKVEEYPIPANTLIGTIRYTGAQNNQVARGFINELNGGGFSNSIVPNFDKMLRLFDFVDSNGTPKEKSWEPDNHSIAFICNMDNSFSDAVEIAKNYFNNIINDNLSISMFSSNGDRASINKIDGIVTVFVD